MFNTTYPKNPVEAKLVTTAGGAAAEEITLPNVRATDIVSVILHTAGAVPRTISNAVAGAGKVTVTFSGDPSTDHVINLIVLREGL